MKMKLVQLLAKELKEWPESVVVYFQWGNGEVFATSKGVPTEYSGSMWYVVGRDIEMAYDAPMYDKRIDLADDHDTAIVSKAKWQAEREKMNKPKWIRHRGGKCPVADDVKVLYRMRSGTITSRGEPSSILSWDHSKSGADIMAYRVIEETKDQEIEEVIPKHMAFGYASKEEMVAQIGEECPFSQVASTAEKTNFGTITYKLEIDATEAAKDIDSLVAKWGQIESPLKWRDEIIELEAYEEEFRRERERLILKLESEGFKLIDHMAPVYGEQIIDFSDWRNWQVGDVFVTDGRCEYYTKGKEYVVKSLVDDDSPIKAIDDYGDVFCLYMNEVKFIRRP